MNFKFFKETSNEYIDLCNQHGWAVSWDGYFVYKEYIELCVLHGWEASQDGYFAYIGGIREARKKWVA